MSAWWQSRGHTRTSGTNGASNAISVAKGKEVLGGQTCGNLVLIQGPLSPECTSAEPASTHHGYEKEITSCDSSLAEENATLCAHPQNSLPLSCGSNRYACSQNHHDGEGTDAERPGLCQREGSPSPFLQAEPYSVAAGDAYPGMLVQSNVQHYHSQMHPAKDSRGLSSNVCTHVVLELVGDMKHTEPCDALVGEDSFARLIQTVTTLMLEHKLISATG